MYDAPASLGTWIRRRRKALDLTQQDLARRMNCALSTVRKWEADVRRPGRGIVERLADTLAFVSPERELFVRVARHEAWAGDVTVGAVPAAVRVAPPSGSSWPPLPAAATPLIGRSREVAAVCVRLTQPDVRLLTLTGPGGIGKTRLALQVASDLWDEFGGRVAVVSLAALRDPALVLPAIVRALGIPDPGERMLDALAGVLRTGPALLILDNFEHLLAAGVDIAALLVAAPSLTVLVTSRAALRLTGEQQVPVPPLTLPDVQAADTIAVVMHSEAGALFLQRARAVAGAETVTPVDARAIAAICRHLEGLPLAIELAAARSAVLAPADLLERLTPRLPLLTDGSRDLPARQQTIRATLDWSYALLAPAEQALFRRLAVFAGGCTVHAAESVCGDAAVPAVINSLQTLLDHSLIQGTDRMNAHGATERRFTMLDLVQEYAGMQLVTHGELPALQRLHAAFVLDLAAAGAHEPPGGAGQLGWLDVLDADFDNVRTALEWTIGHGEPALAVRLAAALGPFWLRRNYVADGCRWLNAALRNGAHDPAVDPALHAEALFTLTTLVSWGGTVEPDLLSRYGPADDQLNTLLDACQALYAQVQDPAGLAAVLGLRAWKAWRSDYPLARALHEEQLALARASGNQRGIAEALKGLGRVSYNVGDFGRAFALFDECLHVWQALGDRYEIAGVYFDTGVAAYYQGDFPRATANLSQQLALSRELGDGADSGALIHLSGVAGCQGDYAQAQQLLDAVAAQDQAAGQHTNPLALRFQGQLACQQSRWTEARAVFGSSLRLWHTSRVHWEVGACLDGLGRVAAGQGAGMRAARIWGAADALRRRLGAPLYPVDEPWYTAALAQVRVLLGGAGFAAAWAEGQAMALQHAIAYALDETTAE